MKFLYSNDLLKDYLSLLQVSYCFFISHTFGRVCLFGQLKCMSHGRLTELYRPFVMLLVPCYTKRLSVKQN